MAEVCRICGATLLPEARFCVVCGNKVPSGSACGDPSVEKPTEQDVGQTDGVSTDKPPKQFETLMKAIWLAIGFSALSSVIGLFDVQQYYQLGRFGAFLLAGGDIALSIWLALAIACRKNWARVTFIVMTLFGCALQYKFFSTDGNMYCIVLDCAALVLDLYCVALLLFNKVAHCFVKLRDGVRRAMIFWGVFAAYLILLVGYGIHYQTANEAEYINNCAEAAACGSEAAYQELIDYSDGCEDISRSDVDAFVESKRQEVRSGRWAWRKVLFYIAAWCDRHGGGALVWCVEALGKLKLAALGKVKVAGKAIAVLGALLCGVGAWLKKTFVDGGDSK